MLEGVFVEDEDVGEGCEEEVYEDSEQPVPSLVARERKTVGVVRVEESRRNVSREKLYDVQRGSAESDEARKVRQSPPPPPPATQKNSEEECSPCNQEQTKHLTNIIVSR